MMWNLNPDQQKRFENALNRVHNFDNCSGISRYQAHRDSTYVMCAIEEYAEKHDRWAIQDFDNGELLGLS